MLNRQPPHSSENPSISHHYQPRNCAFSMLLPFKIHDKIATKAKIHPSIAVAGYFHRLNGCRTDSTGVGMTATRKRTATQHASLHSKATFFTGSFTVRVRSKSEDSNLFGQNLVLKFVRVVGRLHQPRMSSGKSSSLSESKS